MKSYKSYLQWLVHHRQWWGVLDYFSHRWSHTPKRVQYWICNKWDDYLGINDDDDS